MNTTIPAPFETPAALPGCPYECVRLGLGLRFHDAARMTFLVVATALLAIACGGAVAPGEDPTPTQVCTAHGSDDCPSGAAPILYTCTDWNAPDAFVAQATPDRYQPGSFCAPCSNGVDGCPDTPEPRIIPPAPQTCDLGDTSDTYQVFQFSDHTAQAPGCKDLDGGRFLCPIDYCLVLPYTGTCPHCGGGGE